LLAEVFALRTNTGNKVNIFATSRPIPEITDLFQDATSLEMRAKQEDVETYIAENMAQLPSFVERDRGVQD